MWLIIETIITLILQIIDKILDLIKIENKKYLYIIEENLKIDCFDFLKQVTKTNRSIIPYKSIINYYIDDMDYMADIVLYAKCNVNSYSSYEFTTVSTVLKKYEDMECVGYDLNTNPNVEIRPKLISPDGFSKRLSLQLNKCINKGDNLKIQLKYKSYGSMSGDKRYIISGCNYKRMLLDQHTIYFNFSKSMPKDIRVYEINSLNNTYHFLYRLFPNCTSNVFVDNCDVNNINRYIKRLYIFN